MKYLLSSLLLALELAASAQDRDTGNYIHFGYVGSMNHIIYSQTLTKKTAGHWIYSYVHKIDERSYAHAAQAVRWLNGRQNYYRRDMLANKTRDGWRKLPHMFIHVQIYEHGKVVTEYYVRGLPRCLEYCEELSSILTVGRAPDVVLQAVRAFEYELQSVPHQYRQAQNYIIPAFRRPFCFSNDSLYP